MTGRPVRVAVIDSGVSLPHPHIGTIAAGVDHPARWVRPLQTISTDSATGPP